MKKFVLIDNTAEYFDVANLEYAVRVLTEAKALGYEPVLVVNKRFKQTAINGIKVCPSYQHYLHRFEAREQIVSRYLRPMQDAYKKLSIAFVMKIVLARAGLLGHKIFIKIDERLPFIEACRLRLKVFLKKFSRVFIAAPFNRFNNNLLFKEATACFLQGTQSLFKELSLTAGDIVYLPNTRPLELHALTQFFHAEPNAPKVSWHLLFRQNIYKGREPDYFYQNESLRGLRCGFAGVEATLATQDLSLYADTIELTRQYACLGILKFMTLPVCIDAVYLKSIQDDSYARTLCVSYLGEARAEKGYPYLPSIVQDVWADYVSTGKIRFVLQSHCTASQAEPAIVVARAQLACFPESQVKLLAQSLSSSDYRNVLLSSDIVIIPYDAEAYYARSASVFVEALAAGIPVVVPAASWMATQLSRVITDYHQSLCADLTHIEARQLQEFSWHTDEELLTPPINIRNMLMKERLSYYASAAVPSTATHAVVFFESVRNTGGEYLTVSVNQQDKMQRSISKSKAILGGLSGEAQSCLIELGQGVDSLSIELKNSFSNYCLEVNRFEINFIMSKVALPESVVGVVYSDAADVAAALKTVIKNYAHYQATAQAFSDAWRDYHGAGNLLKILVDNKNSVSSPSKNFTGEMMRVISQIEQSEVII
jgi:hypothetical protein